MSKNKFIDTTEDCIGLYLKEVRKTTLITHEEEIELSKRIKKGDETALQKLCKSNLRFVIKIAKLYQNNGIPLPDLISEGNYGLCVAAHRFDHTKGFRFTSYAVWWIRQSILQCLNDNSRMVRLPGNILNKLSKIKKKISLFDGEPCDNMIEKINIPTCTSLNVIMNEEGDELIDVLENDFFETPDIFFEKEEEIEGKSRELELAMFGLSDREIEILNCYFGIYKDPMTLESIGDNFGLTKERVRQIKEASIRKIRNNLGGVKTSEIFR
jgi:RNA polymerase primary sigma factor